jgi:hypothetical protein
VTVRRAAVALALAVLAVGCTSTHKYDPLPVPEESEGTTPTSSTIPTNLDEIPLAAVGGTTSTTTAMGPGPVTISGRVDGPDGPVANGRVHLERLVGDGVASVEVPTAADGSWNVQHVLGGRYRIRAYQVPSLGMARAQVFFVESPKAKPVVLKVERFDGVKVDTAIAPNPPVVGTPANLVVRLTTRTVLPGGTVQATPAVNETVTLSGSGSWSTSTANPSFTDAAGQATFEVTCGATGPQPLSVQLTTGDLVPLDLPGCT